MSVTNYERHPGQKANDSHMPRHVAIIMDGNGRWAKSRGFARIKGHSQGKERVRDIVKACINRKIKALTLFAFGQENWKRPSAEVRHLLRLFYVVLHREIKQLSEQGVRVRIFGDTSQLPKPLRDAIELAHRMTHHHQTLHLNLMFNYSGRWDILQAIEKTVQHPNAQTDYERIFESQLCLFGLPEPDLLIRTAGVQRISNFMLWDLAYTELYFTQTHWPDFNEQALDKGMLFYQRQERRFGLISEQLETC